MSSITGKLRIKTPDANQFSIYYKGERDKFASCFGHTVNFLGVPTPSIYPSINIHPFYSLIKGYECTNLILVAMAAVCSFFRFGKVVKLETNDPKLKQIKYIWASRQSANDYYDSLSNSSSTSVKVVKHQCGWFYQSIRAEQALKKNQNKSS